jgi:tetratricopeptide (TPR) repeat protein
MTVKPSRDQLPNVAATLVAKNEILDLPRSTLNLYSTIWYNLGLIYDRLGSFGEAIISFQMSLGLRRSMFGNDSADVACLMYNIAVLQMEQQLLTEATESFREALRIRRVTATGQLNDLHVLKTLQKLASLHKSKGNIDGSLEARREILEIQKVSTDFEEMSRKKEIGATLREIAELYYAVGNVETAILKARESVTLLRELQALPRNTVDSYSYVAQVEELFAALLLLGSLYHEKCEPIQARVLFAEASHLVYQATRQFSVPTTLDALREVSKMLATCHCSPTA